MLTIIILICSLALFVLALLTLLKDKSSMTNTMFSMLVFAQIGWIVANYASLSDYSFIDTLTAVRLIMFFVVLLNTLFLLFCKVFPEQTVSFNRKKLFSYLAFSLFTAILALSPLVFRSVEIVDGVPVTEPGVGIAVFGTHAFISIVLGFKSLVNKLKSSSKVIQRQIRLLLVASVLTWVVVPLTNFVGTQALNTTLFVQLSPVYTLLF